MARVRGARGGALARIGAPPKRGPSLAAEAVSRYPPLGASEGRIAVNERADNVSYPEDVGAKDFKMGATGLLLCAGLAILFAIIF